MKRHPSSWSIVFAAPKNEARILRKSALHEPKNDAAPLARAEDHEIDALVSALGEMPGRRASAMALACDPEMFVATVPLPFRPPRPAFPPPAPRHEPVLAKVLVDDALLVPPPVKRKARELDVTQLSMRRCREAMAELPTARPLAPAEIEAPGSALMVLGFCAFAFGLGSVVAAIVSGAATM